MEREYNYDKLISENTSLSFIGLAEGLNGETMAVYRENDKLYVKTHIEYMEMLKEI